MGEREGGEKRGAQGEIEQLKKQRDAPAFRCTSTPDKSSRASGSVYPSSIARRSTALRGGLLGVASSDMRYPSVPEFVRGCQGYVQAPERQGERAELEKGGGQPRVGRYGRQRKWKRAWSSWVVGSPANTRTRTRDYTCVYLTWIPRQSAQGHWLLAAAWQS